MSTGNAWRDDHLVGDLTVDVSYGIPLAADIAIRIDAQLVARG